MDSALKKWFFDAVNSTYIFALHNVFTEYLGFPTKDNMNHLMSKYGNMTLETLK